MKYIAFSVSSLTRNGIVKVVSNLANALAQSNEYKIAIICTNIKENQMPVLDERVSVFNLQCPRLKKTDYFRTISPIRELAKQERFDTIVVSGMEWVLFYHLALKGLPIRMLAWEHRNFNAGPKLRLEWIGKRLACKKWDGVICITKRDHQYYCNYACDAARIHQIYNLVAFSTERQDYDAQSRKIVSCGYLDPIKGFDMLMEVAKGLLEKNSDWTWDIYGEGKERENLERLIAEYGLEKHVFLKGFCADINERYGEYSMFVLTSRMEGLGLVIVEAQKAGLPVVAFDIDYGPSDVIADGQNGYLIPCYETEKMVDKILLLQTRADLREVFSHHSEQKLMEFETEFILNKWKVLLENQKPL